MDAPAWGKPACQRTRAPNTHQHGLATTTHVWAVGDRKGRKWLAVLVEAVAARKESRVSQLVQFWYSSHSKRMMPLALQYRQPHMWQSPLHWQHPWLLHVGSQGMAAESHCVRCIGVDGSHGVHGSQWF